MSYAQVTETLSCLLGHAISGRPEVEISLIGIGMSAATLTQEAKRALEESDVVFGAERMLEVVENSKETYPFYLAKDILPVLRQKGFQNGWPETEGLHIIFPEILDFTVEQKK